MTYTEVKCVATNIRPDTEIDHKIQFIADVNGVKNCIFDPFVSCHLEWWEAMKWIGRKVTFIGFLGSGNAWLVSEIIEVQNEE
jgi:hypothetical protein